MKSVIEFPAENGQSVLVEIDVPEQEGIERAARPHEILTKSAQTFEDALEAIRPAITAIINKLLDYRDLVDQVEVEFGVKFGAKADVLIASADTQANLKVKLSWKHRD